MTDAGRPIGDSRSIVGRDGRRYAFADHRCFACGDCTGCDTCLVYCPEGAAHDHHLHVEDLPAHDPAVLVVAGEGEPPLPPAAGATLVDDRRTGELARPGGRRLNLMPQPRVERLRP